MPRTYQDLPRLVLIQEGQEPPLLLISRGIQPDSPLPNPTTETEPKKGVKEEEEKGKKEEVEEKGENYGASRESKMATRGIRNLSSPYSSPSRSRRSVGVQTSFSSGSRSTSTSTSTFWDRLFVGTPRIYNVCSCKNHTCPKDKN